MPGQVYLISEISGLLSGILEWARRVLYPDIKENVYEVMINGASEVPPGAMV